MLNIYLTRHGETVWNREKRFQGWKDSKLTETGIQNARLLGKRLANVDLKAIYTSPSERAFQTATYICSGRPIPILTDAALKEMFFGEWEGKTQEEIEKNYKKEIADFWTAPQHYDPRRNHGETLNDLQTRLTDAIQRIVRKNSDGNILIVTHGVAIRMIMAYMMGISVEEMWKSPIVQGTSLSVFQWNGASFQTQMVGDTTHIEMNK